MPHQLNAKFNCPKCGSNPLNLIFADKQISDASVVCCQGCGVELGNYAEVRKLSAESTVLKMRQEIFKSFKSANWKI